MKKLLTLLVVLSSTTFFAQTNGITYQAVILNPAGQNIPGYNNQRAPLANKNICIKFNIYSGTALEYQETQTTTTDEFGMVNLVIGNGNPVGGSAGTFSDITWGNGPMNMKVEVDLRALCSNFQEISDQPFTTVPYALFAANSGTPGPAGQDGDDGDNTLVVTTVEAAGTNCATGGVKLEFGIDQNNNGTLEPGEITTGLTKYICNGAIGAQGIQGIPGVAGATGPQGIQGAAGAQGLAGTNGINGTNGIDGAVGQQGIQGEQGTIGLTGPAGADGINGVDGAVGPQGPQGLTGATGAQGPIGLTGSAGANGINGTNGIDGAVGPQGIQGLTGATGAQGPIGLTGPAGTNGTNGVDGAVGPQGLTGATGAQGPIGLTGPAGANGANGVDGAVGPQGIQGLTGATGSQGPIGLTGPAGANGTNGIDGAVGPQGPQGPQGIQGLTGATGAQGPIGLTGPSGANGTNGIDGAVGPQGPQGIQGLTGATGPQGLTGATGAQGPVGLTGPAGANGTNGIDGAVGPQGPQGIQGLTGATGSQGPIGLTGPSGANGTNGIDGAVGPQGPQGIQGLTGATGPAGANGTNGTNGMSAYQVAVANGFVGTETQWLLSLLGATGTTGPQGATGATGAAGPQGPQGPQGITGLSAYQLAIANGFVGTETQWLLSLLGATGPAGPQGEEGPSGVGIAQTISLEGSTITLSDNGGSISNNDADSDPTNELQVLSLANNILTLSNGNSVNLAGLTIPSSSTPPGFANNQNSNLPILGAASGCMTIGTADYDGLIDAVSDGAGGYWILAQGDATGVYPSSSVKTNIIHLNQLGAIVSKFAFNDSNANQNTTYKSLFYDSTINSLFIFGDSNRSTSLSSFVYKISSNGVVQGAFDYVLRVGFNTAALSEGKGFKKLPNGNYVFLAQGNGLDLVVLDANLDVVSKVQFNPLGANSSMLYDLIVSPDGSIYCLYRSIVGIQDTATLTKFDTNLSPQWTKFLGEINDSGQLALDASNNVIVGLANATKLRYYVLTSAGAVLYGKQINFDGAYATTTGYILGGINYNAQLNRICLVGQVYKTGEYFKGFAIWIDAAGSSYNAVVSTGPFNSVVDNDQFTKVLFEGSSSILFGSTVCSGLGQSDIKIVKVNPTYASCCVSSSTLSITNNTTVSSTTLNVANPTISKTAWAPGATQTYVSIQSTCFE